ncbi:MAG TPA: DMT family transporter [Actinomycetota bacterium]|nr:DMT family transporter [Actinomycetota bacterium]
METAQTQPLLGERASWLPWALLALGVGAASVSAILVRYADGADALALSFWRCVGGAAALLPFATAGLRRGGSATLRAPVVAGVFLMLHFATWMSSVNLTTVAASVLLVSTTPVFVAIAALVVYGERLPGLAWAGILLATGGAAVVGGGSLEGSSFAGNALAVAGAATAGGYVMAGQVARRTLGILEYAVVTYSVAAVLLLVVCLVAGIELAGYPAGTWWAIAGLVVGPQLLGHTVINLVLSDIDATTVSVTIMAEPVVATALAFLLFDEVPTWLLYPGGVAILAGIYLVSTARREPVVIVE